MSEYTDEKRDAILAKVRKLLERADHPGTPEAEAESARTMAESLMLKYRLDEATAVMKGDTSVTPMWKEVDLVVSGSEFATFYHQLAGTIMRHVGAEGVTSWKQDEEGRYWTILRWVGYSSDLTYGEMLLTACMMEFGKRLEPRYDPAQSDRDNIYAMRSAGMERKRIAKIVYGDWSTENEMKAKNRKVTKEFIAACEERGEDHTVLTGRGNNVKTYRESYARGFVQTMHQRLWRMRTAQGETGSGLVLADRSERVKEAFYQKYPQYRPRPREEAASNPCEKCAKAKSGYCRAHKPRSYGTRTVTHNDAAYSRGGAAAAMVDLGPNATGRGRVSTPASTRSIG